LGNCNGQEEAFRIKIIFAGFVDDADLTMLEGIGIRKGKVDLPFLQRNGIAFVSTQIRNRAGVRLSFFIVGSSQEPFNLVFLSTYPRRLVPVNLNEMSRAIRESNLRNALPLAPTTLP
jgi:hypothetical protein